MPGASVTRGLPAVNAVEPFTRDPMKGVPMTLIRASSLSRADMARLGNNVLPAVLSDRRGERSDGRPAAHGESTEHLEEADWPRRPTTIAGAAGWVC